tara:strand:+ start:265 stop:636 length:372 start_codon:yes stop_codon:yes gene_type:complete
MHILLKSDNNGDIEKLINISEISSTKNDIISHILKYTNLNLFCSYSCEGGFVDDESMMKKDLRFKSPGSSIWNHHYNCISLYNRGYESFSVEELKHIGGLIIDYFNKYKNIKLNLHLTTESVN